MRHKRVAFADLRIVLPQEKTALFGVARVEVFAFVRAVLFDDEEKGRFAAVACVRQCEVSKEESSFPTTWTKGKRLFGRTEPLPILKKALLARRELLRFGP